MIIIYNYSYYNNIINSTHIFKIVNIIRIIKIIKIIYERNVSELIG